MVNSLLEQLPKIVAKEKREAEKILGELSRPGRVTLQTNELVILTPAVSGVGLGRVPGKVEGSIWRNRLTYGDNLLAMQALLAGDSEAQSLRGKLDLIYIDPPFDSRVRTHQ